MRKGFTLIEVMMAVVVLGIILIALTQGVIVGIRHNAYLEHKKIATELAQSKLNELSSLSTNEITDGTENRTISPLTYTISWSATSTTSPAGKDIQVTVSWQEMEKSHSVTLTTWKRD